MHLHESINAIQTKDEFIELNANTRVTLQEVETILHDRFRHRGGISNLKKK